MEEKLICCCGSGGWTKVIGWFQIVLSVIVIIIFSLALFGFAAGRAKVDEAIKSGGTHLTPEGRNSLKTAFSAMVIVSAIMLVLAVLSFVMAIVLILGSYTRNTRFIHYWMVYTIISLVIGTIHTIIQSFVDPIGGGIASPTVVLVFELVVQSFCFWVVGTHKKEIEASGTPVFPVKA